MRAEEGEQEASRTVCEITNALCDLASDEEAEEVILEHLSGQPPAVIEIVYSRIDIVLGLRKTAATIVTEG